MERIRKFENGAQAFGGAIGGVLTFVLYKSRLATCLGDNLYVGVAFLGCAALIWFLGRLPYLLLSLRVLRPFLLGGSHIEGCWVDVSINHRTQKIVSYAVIEVFWEDGRFQLAAESFDSKDRTLGTFSSDELYRRGRLVRFAFKLNILRRRLHNGGRSAEGYCEVTFSRANGRARGSYEGWYFLSIHDQVLTLSGCRVQCGWTKALGRPKEVDELVQPFAALGYSMVPWLSGMKSSSPTSSPSALPATPPPPSSGSPGSGGSANAPQPSPP